MKKKNKVKDLYEVYDSIRRDWNGINPITKVVPNKKKYKRQKSSKHLDEILK